MFLWRNLPFFPFIFGGGWGVTTWQLTFFCRDVCCQTVGTLQSNPPCRYVQEVLEVPAFRREQRQGRVGAPHIPVLWLIQRSKSHLDFKVPSWLHLNVKIHEKKSDSFLATNIEKHKTGPIRPTLHTTGCAGRSKTTTEMVNKVCSIMINAGLQRAAQLVATCCFSAHKPTYCSFLSTSGVLWHVYARLQ